jgi:hypothetical protein
VSPNNNWMLPSANNQHIFITTVVTGVDFPCMFLCRRTPRLWTAMEDNSIEVPPSENYLKYFLYRTQSKPNCNHSAHWWSCSRVTMQKRADVLQLVRPCRHLSARTSNVSAATTYTIISVLSSTRGYVCTRESTLIETTCGPPVFDHWLIP